MAVCDGLFHSLISPVIIFFSRSTTTPWYSYAGYLVSDFVRACACHVIVSILAVFDFVFELTLRGPRITRLGSCSLVVPQRRPLSVMSNAGNKRRTDAERDG
jgi:hypothetical protein